MIEIDDLGDSEAVLANKSHLRRTARASIKRGVIPEEDGWGGWLGRYQAALRKTALDEIDRNPPGWLANRRSRTRSFTWPLGDAEPDDVNPNEALS